MALVPRLYDSLLEPLVRGYRRAGIDLTAPQPGDRVLDVGCGTGTHLAMYADAGCRVAGVDTNEAMVSRARRRLGSLADIRVADAADLPFEARSFDLAVAMLVLHEMDPFIRSKVLQEMVRVARACLVIDHDPHHDGTVRGRAVRTAATGIERIVGGEHYRNFRQFVADGGVPKAAEAAGFSVLSAEHHSSGTMGLYLIG